MNIHTDKFGYTFADVLGGMNILLTKLETSEVKIFFLAGHTVAGSSARYERNLDNLTEDQLNSFFSKVNKKKEKKNG